MYEVLLFIHVVCAVIWVGGAFYQQLLAVLVQRSNDPSELPRLAAHIEFLGTRIFAPVALLILASGAVMTIQNWSFDRTWILIAIILWVVSAVAGAAYLGPGAKRAVALFAADGPESPAGRSLVARLFLVSRLELASFAVILAMMVFKP